MEGGGSEAEKGHLGHSTGQVNVWPVMVLGIEEKIHIIKSER